MAPDEIAALFTRKDGGFLCARWGRPVAPVIFGLAEDSLAVFRVAIRAGFAHARHPMADADPEMGANLMLFFMRDWNELADVPDLDRLTGQPDLSARLLRESADHYRLFRFDADGGIRACLSFLRVGESVADSHPAALAERVVMQSALSFAAEIVPSARIAALIRAAYDPVLPVVSRDAAHALRLAARMQAAGLAG